MDEQNIGYNVNSSKSKIIYFLKKKENFYSYNFFPNLKWLNLIKFI